VNECCPFLVPVSVVQEIQASLGNSYAVSLLGENIITSRNVFPPNSQETIALFSEGLKGLSIADCRLSIEKADNQQSTIINHQSSILDVLDMGCGSGCLSLLAAQVFEGRNINIVATDHLPEALATTKINIQKFIQSKKIPADVIEVTQGGDLFEPIHGRRFDVIIFNAPWVVAPARNRAETAIHDPNQTTVRRFFSQAEAHLKDGGYILLGYSDNSGSKAIEKLEDIIQNADFQIVNLLKERVQTRRTRRKWETIFVYTCVKRET
jgi:methylase of polypeptide subunit release factors